MAVSLSTSYDSRFPPEAVLDGNPSTFWMTTGLYPQELMLYFVNPVTLSGITIRSVNVRHIKLEVSKDEDAANFKTLMNEELADQEGRPQEKKKSFTPASARHLKLVVNKGYDHFATIYSIEWTRA